jgi:hypothetical protein
MEFIEHAIAWCKGEIFEAKLILLFGIIVLVSAFLFFKGGTTPSAKAMLYPLLVVGIMYSAIGGGMLYSNPKRIVEFKQAYAENPTAFIESEKKRTDEFISWYPKTRYIMMVLGVIGILLFLFWAVPIGRAIGISLIIMMLGTFVVDHFSEERAEIYHKHIIESLE